MPTEDRRTDDQLVAAANRGDAAAMSALYIRYRRWVHNLAFRFTGDPELAADVTQETFAYLLSKFPGLQLRAKLTTFLYPAVKNNALAAKRKKRPQLAGDEVESYLAPPLPDAPPDRTSADLAQLVNKLPDGQREVLLMRAVDDMAIAEIALSLGIPEGTVKSRLHHAIRAMKGLMKTEIP